MIYGLISDIHSNLEALDAVLAGLAGVEAFLCLGDIVGYGPDPVACLARVRTLPSLECIVGNHDLAAIGQYDLEWFNPYARAAVEWTAAQLSADEREYLGALPLRREVAGAVLVHGSLPEPMEYVTSPQEALDCFDAFGGSLCFVGHTHITEFYRRRGGEPHCDQIGLSGGGRIRLEREWRYLINPGSVGQPRDGNPEASFGIYDSRAQTVELRRVGYDIAAVQRKMQAAGLPQYLIERLPRGL